MANFAYMDGKPRPQNVPSRRQAADADARELRQPVDDLQLRAASRIGGGLRYSDETFVNTANTIVVPGYHLVDAVATYAVNPHLTLRLNVYNLTDEVYIRSINNNGGRYNPGYTRSFLLSTQIGF